jgi:hypothetical protein
MHFHLPKPLHGWRQLAGEVGIIVVGVLIALAAEQLVEMLHWRQQVKQAQEQFRDELTAITVEAYVQVAIEQCVSEDLDQIQTRLNRPSIKWTGMGGDAQSVIRVPFRPPAVRWNIIAEGWNNAVATGVVNHLPYRQARTLSQAYAEAKQLVDHERAESEAAAKLSPLSADRSLSPQTQIEMLQTVNELQRINYEIQSDSMFILGQVPDSGLGLTEVSLHKDLDFAWRRERVDLGTCVTKPNDLR